MSSPSYIKGRKKEYKIVKEYRDKGYNIVQRTAGSHSPIDIIAVNKSLRVITLIQAKPDNFNSKKIEEDNRWLNNIFRVEFVVL